LRPEPFPRGLLLRIKFEEGQASKLRARFTRYRVRPVDWPVADS